jgi:hypothetical protein
MGVWTFPNLRVRVGDILRRKRVGLRVEYCANRIVTKALSVTVFVQLMIVTDKRSDGRLIVAIANACSQITLLNIELAKKLTPE